MILHGITVLFSDIDREDLILFHSSQQKVVTQLRGSKLLVLSDGQGQNREHFYRGFRYTMYYCWVHMGARACYCRLWGQPGWPKLRGLRLLWSKAAPSTNGATGDVSSTKESLQLLFEQKRSKVLGECPSHLTHHARTKFNAEIAVFHCRSTHGQEHQSECDIRQQ